MTLHAGKLHRARPGTRANSALAEFSTPSPANPHLRHPQDEGAQEQEIKKGDRRKTAAIPRALADR